MPAFVIITPVFNGIDHLKNLRNALEQQTIKDFEWVVINDGSKDATSRNYEKIIEGLNFPAKILHVANGGQGRARNLGISESIAPWVCTIDVDDMPYTNKIETIMLLIQGYSEEQAIIGAHSLRTAGNIRGRERNVIPVMFSNDHKKRMIEIKGYFRRASNPFPTSGVFFSRWLVEETGVKYCEDRKLIGAEDYIFKMMAVKVADQIVITDKVCGSYLIHPGNISNVSNPTLKVFLKSIGALEKISEGLGLEEELSRAISSKCISAMNPLNSSSWKFRKDVFKYGVMHEGLTLLLRALLAKVVIKAYTSLLRLGNRSALLRL